MKKLTVSKENPCKACLSCVVDTVDGKRRACVDGPVFPASEVVW